MVYVLYSPLSFLTVFKLHELFLSNTLFYLNCCLDTNGAVHVHSSEISSFQFNTRKVEVEGALLESQLLVGR